MKPKKYTLYWRDGQRGIVDGDDDFVQITQEHAKSILKNPHLSDRKQSVLNRFPELA